MSGQEYVDQEINLRDCINVIIKRKRIILIMILIPVIATATVSLLLPKTYQSVALIQTANVNEPVLKKSEIETIVKTRVFLNPIIKDLKLNLDAKKLNKYIKLEDIKDTDFMKVKVEYKSQDTSLKICEAIVNKLLDFGNNIYQERIKLINRQLEEVNEQINATRADIKRRGKLTEDITSMKKSTETPGDIKVILPQEEVPNYEINLLILLNHRNELLLKLNKAKDFKTIDPPIKPEYSIRPDIKLNVVISGIVGLIFGLYLVFFMESWESHKQARS